MKEEKHILERTGVVVLLALLCCFLWGSAFPAIKIGYQLFSVGAEDTAAQILFAGIRFTIAGMLVVLIYSIRNKALIVPKRTSWGMICVIALLQTILQYFFFYVGLAHTTGVKASIMEGSHVFMAILLACLLFKQEKMTWQKTVGCVVGFSGVILINLTDASQLGGGFRIDGEGFLLIACGAYAMSSIFIKIFSEKESPVTISGYQFILGGLVMTVVGLAMGGEVMATEPAAYLLLIYLALISAVAYSIWGLLLQYNPVSRISIFGFSNPVFGVVLSAIFLKEGSVMPWGQSLIALGLVSLGIFVVNKGNE